MSTSHHPSPARDPREFWENHYTEHRDRFAGNPNRLALDHLEDLEPGRALEIGCGQGADAIWLAQRGWTVLAVDLAEAILRVAEDRCREAGVADRITWRRHDLSAGVPEGAFHLVLSSYTQSPVALERIDVLRQAADRVAPGGVLLIVGHAGNPSWAPEQDHGVAMPDAATLVASLDLPSGDWTVDHQEDVARDSPAPDGRPGTRLDAVVRLRRR